MAQLKFPVSIESSTKKESKKINVEYIVPAGDVPHYIKIRISTSKRIVILNIVYDNPEVETEVFQDEIYTIHFSKKTGRVYKVMINNYTVGSRSQGIYKALDSLQEQTANQRVFNNFEISKTLIKHGLQLSKTAAKNH